MKSKPNWKAVTLDYDALAGFDDLISINICLTQKQVAILKALLSTAYWETRWANLSIPYDELNAYIAVIDSQLSGNDCGGDMLDFRDNPDDVCEVQYTKDGGENWLTMFRKDVCIQPSLGDVTIINNSKTEIENNNVTYDGDIINIAPQWEYSDQQSDSALCWAIDFWVEAMSDLQVNEIEAGNVQRRSANDFWSDLVSVLTGAVIAASTAITINPIVGGAVAWALTELAEEFWDSATTHDTSDYQDQNARDAIKCGMWLELHGETVQWENWEHSLDLFEPEGAAETAIWETMMIANSSQDAYVNFLYMLEDINSISSGLPPCDCPEPLVIDQLLGDDDQFYGTQLTAPVSTAIGQAEANPAIGAGIYIPETDRYRGTESDIWGRCCNIRVTLPPDVLVYQVKVHWGGDRPNQGTIGDRWCCVWIGDPNDDGIQVAEHKFGAGFYTNQNVVTTESDIDEIVLTPRTHVYIHASMDKGLPDGYVYIDWIHIICIPYVP